MKKSKDQKLRRQLEVLKAQVNTTKVVSEKQSSVVAKTQEGQKSTNPVKINSSTINLNYAEIKRDLLKIAIFSIFTTASILILYFTEQRWINLIKFI